MNACLAESLHDPPTHPPQPASLRTQEWIPPRKCVISWWPFSGVRAWAEPAYALAIALESRRNKTPVWAPLRHACHLAAVILVYRTPSLSTSVSIFSKLHHDFTLMGVCFGPPRPLDWKSVSFSPERWPSIISLLFLSPSFSMSSIVGFPTASKLDLLIYIFIFVPLVYPSWVILSEKSWFWLSKKHLQKQPVGDQVDSSWDKERHKGEWGMVVSQSREGNSWGISEALKFHVRQVFTRPRVIARWTWQAGVEKSADIWCHILMNWIVGCSC